MDWQNQPNPFRFYEGKNIIYLPLLKNDPKALYLDLYRRQNNTPKPYILENIAGFLELSLGLSAWKSVAGNKWSLRINPSSGNLHPTEAHLVLPAMDAIKAGVYHYNPLIHALELRISTPAETWARILNHFGTEGFFIGLSSILRVQHAHSQSFPNYWKYRLGKVGLWAIQKHGTVIITIQYPRYPVGNDFATTFVPTTASTSSWFINWFFADREDVAALDPDNPRYIVHDVN